jgi:hypothetical protein
MAGNYVNIEQLNATQLQKIKMTGLTRDCCTNTKKKTILHGSTILREETHCVRK